MVQTAEAATSKGAQAFMMDVIAPEALSAGEILQLPDGRAGVTASQTEVTSGDVAGLHTHGQFTFLKTASIVILDGAPVYWDRSANTATPLKALAGADFYLGVAVGDATASAATVVVDLNVQPVYTIDLLCDPSDTIIVAGALMVTGPGYTKLSCAVATEAQKVDIMSKASVPVVSGSAIPFIVEGRMAIYDIGNDAALDINVGLANATDSDNGDDITEAVFLHWDGNVLTILAESDDTSTEVAAVTTGVAAVDDTYFDFAFDCRDLTDIQLYINGVNVLPDSVFKLNAATGPMKLIVHMEKSSNDTTAEIRIAKLAIRTPDVT